MTPTRTVLSVVVSALLLILSAHPAAAEIVRSGNITVDLSTMQPVNPVGPVICETDQELLTNGGFETGSLPPWTTNNWSVVTLGPHSGTYCAYDIGNNYVIQNITPTQAAQITSAILWMRQPEAAISAIDWMYQGGSFSEDLIWVTTNWEQYNIAQFIDPGTTVIGLRIWGYSGGGPALDETFLDDVSIQTPGGGLSLNVVMTPINPPISIPSTGGQFNFNAAVTNNGAQTPFWAWARNRYPDGTYTGVLLGPVNINPPTGVTVQRTRTQVVPSTWPPGTHYMVGYAGSSVGYPAADADSFSWTKTVVPGAGPIVWEAYNYGELFPGEVAVSAPAVFNLVGAYPNPFNPTTAISYQLSAFSQVSLKVYDLSGRLVTTLVDGWREAGSHQVTFDGSNLASGVYLYTLQAEGRTISGKMMLVK